jgi:hypothetical protein
MAKRLAPQGLVIDDANQREFPGCGVLTRCLEDLDFLLHAASVEPRHRPRATGVYGNLGLPHACHGQRAGHENASCVPECGQRECNGGLAGAHLHCKHRGRTWVGRLNSTYLVIPEFGAEILAIVDIDEWNLLEAHQLELFGQFCWERLDQTLRGVRGSGEHPSSLFGRPPPAAQRLDSIFVREGGL